MSAAIAAAVLTFKQFPLNNEYAGWSLFIKRFKYAGNLWFLHERNRYACLCS